MSFSITFPFDDPNNYTFDGKTYQRKVPNTARENFWDLEE
jgi:hypothetical protein